MKKVLIGLFVLAAVLVVVKVALAQGNGPVTDDDVNRVAKQLYCPVCENIPLDVCPTQACTQWRATIREKLVAGWSDQQIKDYFAAQYGERVLAQPKTDGFSVLVWIIPPVAVLAGAFVLWRFLRGSPKPAVVTAPAEATGGETDPYVARLEQELERRR